MSPDAGDFLKPFPAPESEQPISLGMGDLLPAFQDIAFGETGHVTFGALNLDAKMRVINKGVGLFSLGRYTAELVPTPEERADALAAFEAQKKSQT